VLKQIGAAALLLLWASGSCTQAQMVGAAIPPVIPPGDHPSNGVVELIVAPVPARLRPRSLTDPPEVYAPWAGVLSVRVGNISLMPASVDYADPLFEYTVQVLDSSGKPVPVTERGRSTTEVASRPRSPFGYYGPASAFELMPGEDVYIQVDLSKFYQVVSGRGLHDQDEAIRGPAKGRRVRHAFATAGA
jgi:hypothetical protein